MADFNSYDEIIEGLKELIKGILMWQKNCQRQIDANASAEAINTLIDAIAEKMTDTYTDLKKAVFNLEDKKQIADAEPLCAQVERELRALENLKK